MPENPEKTETSLDTNERDFLRTLDQLPKEFSEVWEKKYYDIEDPENTEAFFNEFNTYFYKRELALAGDSIEIHEDVQSVDILKEILEVHKSIKHTFGDPNFFLGNGATAEVYTLPIIPNICVKYISDQERYNENNHMRVEYEFLNLLHDFEVDGVRAPHPYFIRIHPSEGHSYGMERIRGESLSRILEEPEKNIELITILKEKDRQEVRDSLVAYVAALHKKFKVTHNDLFQRNIMVDTAGHFYIIDFGKAKHEQIGEDHEVYQKSDIEKVSTSINNFFKGIDEIDIDAIVSKVSSDYRE